MIPISFRPEVEDDAIGAYYWYEEKAGGLGEDFLRIFYASASDLAWNPELYPKIYKNYRRRLLRRFPYALYYVYDGKEIIVYGVFHCARHPGYIRYELNKR